MILQHNRQRASGSAAPRSVTMIRVRDRSEPRLRADHEPPPPVQVFAEIESGIVELFRFRTVLEALLFIERMSESLQAKFRRLTLWDHGDIAFRKIRNAGIWEDDVLV